MRPASAVLRDLLILIERSEFGARAAADGRERWAITCARRAVSANVEQLGPELADLRQVLARTSRWLSERPNKAELRWTVDLATRATRGIRDRIQRAPRTTGRRALALASADRAVEAVGLCIECVASRSRHGQVAELARSSFPDEELEAAAQARRLLICTDLLPSGADLLVRLDYAESIGRIPEDPAERAWIESQRIALMAEDEQARMLMVFRQLELVFLPELDRLR